MPFLLKQTVVVAEKVRPQAPELLWADWRPEQYVT